MTLKRLSKTQAGVIIPLVFIILLQLFSFQEVWVEKYYSNAFYPRLSYIFRSLTGWVPFSLGDIFYLSAAIWLLLKVIRFCRKSLRRQFTRKALIASLRKILILVLWVYIVFNVFWGLNYNRKGIAYQLHFTATQKYKTDDLKSVLTQLLLKVNETKQQVIFNKISSTPANEIFAQALLNYHEAEKIYPFLGYDAYSIKPSLYGYVGSYLGFTGYYNPFSGEAQVNTTVPEFILPYTVCHEMAHQLGYAKEDEANFVGYLAATSSENVLFKYSAYFDLFIYASQEMFLKDKYFAVAAFQELSKEVKADLKTWRDFLHGHSSFARPFADWAYTKYLQMHRQPKGLKTYSEVVSNLIFYYKKYRKI